MRITRSHAFYLALIVTLFSVVHSYGQILYSVGGGASLQTLDLTTGEVAELTTLSGTLGDIAFGPDGELYGVDEHVIYRVDTTDGTLTPVKILPSSHGWLVGLTINRKGIFYMSALGAGSDLIVVYDPSVDEAEILGSTGWPHWDLVFYNGDLYASGGSNDPDEGFLIAVDMQDPANSRLVMDYRAQAFGIVSFNDPCAGQQLIAPTANHLKSLQPDGATYLDIEIDHPGYVASAGATSRTAYLGSRIGPVIDSVIHISSVCSDSDRAEVQVFVAGNGFGMRYSLDGGAAQTSPLFTEVGTGTHTVTAIDDQDCTAEVDFEIGVAEIQLSATITPAHCGQNNGTIRATESSGTGNMEYSIAGGDFSASDTFSGLDAGEYLVIARNDQGCLDSLTVTIDRLPGLEHEIATTEEHCGQEDATLSISANGGQNPYRYSIVALPFQSTPVFSGLHAATYTVRTEDAMGCAVEDAITITKAPLPEILEISTLDANCNMANGSADIIASSTGGSLLYSVNGAPWSSSGIWPSLPGGIHSLSVQDIFGCTIDSSFAIQEIDGPEITEIDITSDNCNSPAGEVVISATGNSALQYSLDEITYSSDSAFLQLAAGNYSVVVRDTIGCVASMEINIEKADDPIIDSLIIKHATCHKDNGSLKILATGEGLNFSLNDTGQSSTPSFEGLSATDHTVTISDVNGCSDTALFSIKDIEPAAIADILIDDMSCEGEAGEVEIILTKKESVQYSIDGIAYQSDPVFPQLENREYTAFIIDENGCVDSLSFLIKGADPVTFDAIEITAANCDKADGSIQIIGSQDISIDHNGQGSGTTYIDDLEAGDYLIVLQNLSGCTLDTLIAVPATNCQLSIPNVFSPNGDGTNDVIKIDLADGEIHQFAVFDRWGNRVYECTGACEWGGSLDLSTGVYTYFLAFADNDGNVHRQSGDITLLR